MRRLITRTTWATVGAASAYLFDPVSGRSRRARLIDQARSKIRREVDKLSKRYRYEKGRARGALFEIIPTEDFPASDEDLLQKVRSEAVGTMPGSVSHVSVSVDDGVVYLAGVSRDQALEQELVDRISNVKGVRAVRDLLVAV
jgi:hypothetical protein